MASPQLTVITERSTLWTVLASLAALAVGIVLLYLSCVDEWWGNRVHFQALLRNFGALLIASVTIAILWHLVGSRAFLDEVLAKTGISKELSHAGVLQITDSFYQEIDWRHLLAHVTKMDIFVAYAQTWRNTHGDEIRAVARRAGTRIRVVLPDLEDANAVAEMVRRFGYSEDTVRTRVQDTIDFFRELARTAEHSDATVKIWLYPGVPQLSLYRFDKIGILAVYSHRRTRAPVPTFVVSMGGTLYNFVREEFHALIDQGGLARPLPGETDVH